MHGMERLKWIPNNNPPKCPTRIGPVGHFGEKGTGSAPARVQKKASVKPAFFCTQSRGRTGTGRPTGV